MPKPSDKILELYNKARKKYSKEDNEGNLWIQAIMDYLDEEYEKK